LSVSGIGFHKNVPVKMEQKCCSWQTTKKKLPGTDEEEKHEKNKRYEEHRPERKLNTKWQEGLQFNLEINLMTCSICMDYYRGKEMPINILKGQNRFLSVSQQKNFCCD
jgi:hypothetical protein